MTTELNINGEVRTVHSPPLTPLARVLREELYLTGTKLPCGEGFCGACMVFIDGEAKVSCLTPIAAVEGAEIQTIESVSPPRTELSPVQGALKKADAVQCGMCFPGMVISLTAMLEEHPHPSREDVDTALVGNICRCTGYERIVDAVLDIGEESAS